MFLSGNGGEQKKKTKITNPELHIINKQHKMNNVNSFFYVCTSEQNTQSRKICFYIKTYLSLNSDNNFGNSVNPDIQGKANHC